MKPVSLLLGLSVAGNFALIAALAFRPAIATDQIAGTKPANSSTVPNAAENSSASVTTGRSAGITAIPQNGENGGWSALSAGTHSEMVARLRAEGYPPAVIRALLAVRFSEENRARREQLMSGIELPPFWDTRRNYGDPKVYALQRELQQEQTRLIKELLGPDGVEENEISRYYRQRQFGDLSPDKASEVQQIAADYNELRNQIYRDSNGVLLPEDRRQLDYIEKELRADVARVLTPEEMQEYELRSSNTASLVRQQLMAFQPTEQEFRALFGVARSIEEQFGSLQGAIGLEQGRQRQAAILEQAKGVLTPERYEAFQQATDPRYGALSRIAARYDLPLSVVPQVDAIQQDIRQRARQVPADQRAAQMAALAQEATTKIGALLGERALEAYKVYGGQWIEQMTATPPPNPSPRPGATPSPKG